MTGGHLSPISDAGYSEKSASEQVAPPRPPKVKDEGPLVPSTLSATSSPTRGAKRDHRPAFKSPLSQERLGVQEEDQKRWSGASASEEVCEVPLLPISVPFRRL